MNDITKQIVAGWIIIAFAFTGFAYGLFNINEKIDDQSESMGVFLRTALVTQGGTQFASTTENALIASGTTTSAALIATTTITVNAFHATGTPEINDGTATSTIHGGLQIITGGSFSHADLVSCDTIDTDINGFLACGSDAGFADHDVVQLTLGGTVYFAASTTDALAWVFLDGFVSQASSTVDSNFSVTGHMAASSTLNVVATSTFDGRMSIATSAPYTSSMLNIEIEEPTDHGLIIQGTIGQDAHLFMLRNNAGKRLFFVEDSGETEIIHVATEDGDHTLHLETDVAGFGDVVGVFNDYDAGTMSAGEDGSGLLVTIDRTNTTGGDIHALLVFTTAAGGAEVIGLELGVGVSPIRHNSGTFGDMDECTSTAGGDILASCIDTGTDATLFAGVDHELVVGDANTFTSIDVSLATEGSKNINAKFEFSTGNDTWTVFSPSDGTNGFQDTSVIAWELTDIQTWATGTSTRYFIRITRTRTGNIATLPVEDKLQISAVTEYMWDDLANVNVNSLLASSTLRIDGLSSFGGGFISTGSSTANGILNVIEHLSASSTASFKGLVSIDDLTSAMIITAGDGLLSEYTGTTCTNQFVQALSVLGAATCSTVDISDDTNAASGNGVTVNGDQFDFDCSDVTDSGNDGISCATEDLVVGAGAHMSTDATNVIAEATLFTHTFSFIVSSSTMSTTTDVAQHKLPAAITISRVSCTTNTGAGTSSINAFIRTELEPTLAGIQILTADLDCGANHTNSTTSFADATVPLDRPISFEVADAEKDIGDTGPGTTPVQIRVHFDYTFDDV